ncbi:MAG: Maf family protein [Bulleidia sp.]
MKSIILASASPRRRELMEKVGFPFICIPADIDETIYDEYTIEENVENIAFRKARAIHELYPDCIAVGSDTMVVLDEEIVLGKPENREDAKRMLRMLEGRTHQVMTGLSLVSDNRRYFNVSVSDVTFSHMSEEEIEEYVNSGECDDKAGAYGIQGLGGRYIESIQGDYYSIMGLPVNLLYEELKKNLSLY